MNKFILLFLVTALTISKESLATSNNNSKGFDPHFLKPESVEKVVDIASQKSEENIGEIRKLYNQYMHSINKFTDKQVKLFKKHFLDN
jgi:hypothetical protein